MTNSSWKIMAVGLGIAALGAGCGAGGDGVVTADLEYVDSSIVARQDLFLDVTIDARPMTLEQLGGERDSAIPVEVEVFGNVAAAWRRSVAGDALPRNADNLVSVWRVMDVVDGTSVQNPTTIDAELETGPDYVPGETDLPRVDGVDIERPGDRVASAEEGVYLLVDWVDRLGLILDRQDLEIARELAERHPGCLE